MPQSLAQLYTHIVFSTKNRKPFIRPEIENELFSYIGGIIKNLNGIPFQINGTNDHIHILSSMPRTVSLSKYVEEIKRNSSKWIKTKGNDYRLFGWQNGYGAFSVSYSMKDRVCNYIKNQKKHHKDQSFKEEMIDFLRDYDVLFEKEYLWG